MMITNSLLGQMSGEDLRTRYESSFVKYNGEVRFIEQLISDGNRIAIKFYSDEADPDPVTFDYRKLDVRRFPAMWVVMGSKFFFVQANATPHARYMRGIQDDTYSFFNLKQNFAAYPFPRKIELLDWCYKAMDFWEEKTFRPIAKDEMFSKPEKAYVPMRNVLLFTDSSKNLMIYLGSKPIHFTHPLYERINNDCIFG